MSLLTIIQDAALELGFAAPETVVGNSDLQTQQLLSHAVRTGKALASEWEWPQLSKEYTFNLVDSTPAYAMPTDFDRFIFCTHWDRTNHWGLIGPMSADSWQLLKSGVSTASIYSSWRFKGVTDTQFSVDPTPSSTTAAVFEYQSKSCWRPQTWVSGTTFSQMSYCFYNGNYYYTAAGGAAGSTAPTHTDGTVSDGTVSWLALDSIYDRPLADTDICLIDEDLVTLGVKYRYQQSKSLDGWDITFQNYQGTARLKASNNRGASPLCLNAGMLARNISYPQVPETGFGS